MTKVEECTKQLLDAIAESEEAARLRAITEKLKNEPEKFARIDRFRMEVFRIQNQQDSPSLLQEMKELSAKRQEIISDPEVEEYLSSELAMCRMLQDICHSVMGTANLSLGAIIEQIANIP